MENARIRCDEEHSDLVVDMQGIASLKESEALAWT